MEMAQPLTMTAALVVPVSLRIAFFFEQLSWATLVISFGELDIYGGLGKRSPFLSQFPCGCVGGFPCYFGEK